MANHRDMAVDGIKAQNALSSVGISHCRRLSIWQSCFRLLIQTDTGDYMTPVTQRVPWRTRKQQRLLGIPHPPERPALINFTEITWLSPFEFMRYVLYRGKLRWLGYI